MKCAPRPEATFFVFDSFISRDGGGGRGTGSGGGGGRSSGLGLIGVAEPRSLYFFATPTRSCASRPKGYFSCSLAVLGNKKKLDVGFVTTRWGRFEVLVDLKYSELVLKGLGGPRGGRRVRPEGPRHKKKIASQLRQRKSPRHFDIEKRCGLLMAAAVPQVFIMLSLHVKYLSLK
jgi:hypothetical protein